MREGIFGGIVGVVLCVCASPIIYYEFLQPKAPTRRMVMATLKTGDGTPGFEMPCKESPFVCARRAAAAYCGGDDRVALKAELAPNEHEFECVKPPAIRTVQSSAI